MRIPRRIVPHPAVAVGCLLAGLAWGAGTPAAAGLATLAADLNTIAPPGGSTPPTVDALQALGNGTALFFSGRQLWRTDGTPLGTAPIHDFCANSLVPPDDCGLPTRFVGVLGGGALLLVTDDSGSLGEIHLWSSDGTIAGTFRLASGLEPASGTLSYEGQTPVALAADALYFFACGASTGSCGLYRSDGTAAGTRPMATGAQFGQPLLQMAAAGGRVFFGLSTSPGQASQDLWTSDGTPAGTLRLGTFQGFFDDNVDFDGLGALFGAGSRAFFFGADPTHGQQLWVSDGTVAGTVPLTAFPFDNPFGAVPIAAAIADRLYLVANDGTHGDQLYASDGSAAGTRAVTSFTAPDAFGRTRIDDTSHVLADLGGRLLFVASDGVHPFGLWTSGGTPATTAPVTGCPGGCPTILPGTPLLSIGRRAVLPVQDAAQNLYLWATNGAGAGTVALGPSCSGCGSFSSGGNLQLTPLAGRALLTGGAGGAGSHGVTDLAVWLTDGTVAGTRILLRRELLVPPFTVNGAAVAADTGKALYFAAYPQGLAIERGQLWASDGSAAGTAPVTPTDGEGPSSYPSQLFAYGGGVLFVANDGQQTALWAYGVGAGSRAAAPAKLLPIDRVVQGGDGPPFVIFDGIAYFLASAGSGTQLWRTDGTTIGTIALTDPAAGTASGLVAFQGRPWFFMYGSTAPALWNSDGTAAGTGPVPGIPDAGGGLTTLGAQLYWLGAPPGGELGLVASDGTPAGTRQLAHWPFDSFMLPPELVRAGGTVYFRAATSEFSLTPRLWRTDGTPAGTVQVLPNPATFTAQGNAPSDLVALGSALLFFGFTGNGDQRGLFRTDGTAAGTVLLAPVAPPYSIYRLDSTVAAGFTALGGRLLFTADDGEHGLELWATDGTAAGTALVRDIAPGAVSSRPSSLVAAGNLIFFSADDGVHGIELWQTDGTAAGTRLVQDIAPGVASSIPSSLTPSAGQLYFSADDGIYGFELWSYPLDQGVACVPSPAAMCLLGGRFQVASTWHDFAGNSGPGHPVALTDDTGYFWFFDPANVEVVLKNLDGRTLNGHFWTFYGALSNVEYELTVTDSQTGAARRYVNPSGVLASVADTSAFGPQGAHGRGISLGPAGVPAGAEITAAAAGTAGAASCAPGDTRLCLEGGRFAVTATWRDSRGNTGVGHAAPVTGDTGYLWFFAQANVEVMLKVLDGRPLNGKFWVFYGALSNVEYTLTVTDTQTGAVRTYHNPAGRLASVADTGAFP